MAAVESAVVDEFEEGVEEEVITIEETMETEELVHSEQEEKRTFVITGRLQRKLARHQNMYII